MWNNAPFEKEDFGSICSIEQSRKVLDPNSTGRFGIGFNSTYHVTDTPILCTGAVLGFLDPLERHFTDSKGHPSTGTLVDLNDDARLQLADTLAPIAPVWEATGWDPDTSTLFRLPLRLGQSPMGDAVQSVDCAQQVVEPFIAMAEQTLLFTRHLRSVEVYEKTDKGVERLMRVQRTDDGSTRSFVTEVRGQEPVSMCYYMGTATSPALTAAAPTMHVPPTVTVAVPPVPMEACPLFCLMPILGVHSRLPFFLDAAFMLGSDRRNLKSGKDLRGRSAKESEWNNCILSQACPEALVDAFMGGVAHTDPADPAAVASLYARLPDPSLDPDMVGLFIDRFWALMREKEFVSDGAAFVKPCGVSLLPPELHAPECVAELREIGLSVVTDSLPAFVREGLGQGAGALRVSLKALLSSLVSKHKGHSLAACGVPLCVCLLQSHETHPPASYSSLPIWPVLHSDTLHPLAVGGVPKIARPPLGMDTDLVRPEICICLDESRLPLTCHEGLDKVFQSKGRLTHEAYLIRVQRVGRLTPKTALEEWQVECLWLMVQTMAANRAAHTNGGAAKQKAKGKGKGKRRGKTKGREEPTKTRDLAPSLPFTYALLKRVPFVAITGDDPDTLHPLSDVYSPLDPVVNQIRTLGADCPSLVDVLPVPLRTGLSQEDVQVLSSHGMRTFGQKSLLAVVQSIATQEDVEGARVLMSLMEPSGLWGMVHNGNHAEEMRRLAWVLDDEDQLVAPIDYPELCDAGCKALGMPTRDERLQSTIGDLIDIGEACGQHEDIGCRISQLIQDYPVKMDLFKELLQNARDAGAANVVFAIDRRKHSPDGVISPAYAACLGPALVAYDDALFTEENWKGVTQLGVGSKQDDESSIGTFGLGFCSVFGLTDVPSIYSGKTLLILDPLREYVPGATDRNPGRKFPDTDLLLSRYPGMGDPYEFHVPGMSPEKGSVIRIPFRTSEQNSHSPLLALSRKRDMPPVTMEDMANVIKGMAGREGKAEELLLFLTGVKSVSFYDISHTGKTSLILKLSRESKELRQAGMSRVCVTKEVYARSTAGNQSKEQRPSSTKRYEYTLVTEGSDNAGEAVTVATAPTAPSPSPCLFVALPTTIISTGLPVYISGPFSLYSTRKQLSKSARNTRLCDLLVKAYCRLLANTSVNVYPSVSDATKEGGFENVASRVLARLHDRAVVPPLVGDRRIVLQDAVFATGDDSVVAEILAKEGMQVAHTHYDSLPSLYGHPDLIKRIQKMAPSFSSLTLLSPSNVRHWLRDMMKAFNGQKHNPPRVFKYKEGPLPSISSEGDLVQLLKYAARRAVRGGLSGLPLLPLSGGRYAVWPELPVVPVVLSQTDKTQLVPLVSGSALVLSPTVPEHHYGEGTIIGKHVAPIGLEALGEALRGRTQELDYVGLGRVFSFVGKGRSPSEISGCLAGIKLVPTSRGRMCIRPGGKAPVMAVDPTSKWKVTNIVTKLGIPTLLVPKGMTAAAADSLRSVCHPHSMSGLVSVVDMLLTEGVGPSSPIQMCHKLSVADRVVLLTEIGEGPPGERETGADAPVAAHALRILRLLPIFPPVGVQSGSWMFQPSMLQDTAIVRGTRMQSVTLPFMQYSHLGKRLGAATVSPDVFVESLLDKWGDMDSVDRKGALSLVAALYQTKKGWTPHKLVDIPFVPTREGLFVSPRSLLLPNPVTEVFFPTGLQGLDVTLHYPASDCPLPGELLATLGCKTQDTIFQCDPSDEAFTLLCARQLDRHYGECTSGVSTFVQQIATPFASTVAQRATPHLCKEMAGLRLVPVMKGSVPPICVLVRFGQCVTEAYHLSVQCVRYCLPVEGLPKNLKALGVEKRPSAKTIGQHILAFARRYKQGTGEGLETLESAYLELDQLVARKREKSGVTQLASQAIIHVRGVWMRPCDLFCAPDTDEEPVYTPELSLLTKVPDVFVERHGMLAYALGLTIKTPLSLRQILGGMAYLQKLYQGSALSPNHVKAVSCYLWHLDRMDLDTEDRADLQFSSSSTPKAQYAHMAGVYGCDTGGRLVQLRNLLDVEATAAVLSPSVGHTASSCRRWLEGDAGYTQCCSAHTPFCTPPATVVQSSKDFQRMGALLAVEDTPMSARIRGVEGRLRDPTLRKALSALIVSVTGDRGDESLRVGDLARLQWCQLLSETIPHSTTVQKADGTEVSMSHRDTQGDQDQSTAQPLLIERCDESHRVYVCWEGEQVPDCFQKAIVTFVLTQLGLRGNAYAKSFVRDALSKSSLAEVLEHSYLKPAEEGTQEPGGLLLERDAVTVQSRLVMEYTVGVLAAYGTSPDDLVYCKVVRLVSSRGVPVYQVHEGAGLVRAPVTILWTMSTEIPAASSPHADELTDAFDRELELVAQLPDGNAQQAALSRIVSYWCAVPGLDAAIQAEVTQHVEEEVLYMGQGEKGSVFGDDPLFCAAQGDAAEVRYVQSFLARSQQGSASTVLPDPSLAAAYLAQARAMRSSAKTLLTQGGDASVVCFLSYQTAELALKAACLKAVGLSDEDIRRHQLSFLAGKVQWLGISLTGMDDDMYVKSRYPNANARSRAPVEVYSDLNARRCYSVGEAVYKACRAFLKGD
ncbi:hypothetical protein KIPB_004246 [Kipferlia bialata]|uniref:HEPN domain-containing protein n=1 Tax=Kipferlia bialata TaxID=797122 RepID=A0A9K3GI30_9EUKA|nr:hypothetical protein KIPB_004246 [Kipferlia bialata]|eukprot:g4246.t1